MAEHVEVVIKIPKYYLTHPQDYSCLAECVRRGTLLPKGHGNLIDVNEITAFTELECNGRNVESLDEFTIIVEADKTGIKEHRDK